MAKPLGYHEEQKREYIEKLREQLALLPPFAEEFFRGANRISSPRTRLAYAYDLKVFFTFICENHRTLKQKEVAELSLSDLELIAPEDIEVFLEYISFYENPDAGKNGREYMNDERAKARKLCAIRSLYKFFYTRRRIGSNPADFVIPPKLHDKNITVMEPNEVALLLDSVESGEKLTERQQKYHEYTQKRDMAIITLLLGTGMRVSELVGIDINDVDFDLNGVRIIRKGGNESTVYFGEEVRECLLSYLEERRKRPESSGLALFLSLQNKRINVRSVQNLVKKYAQTVTLLKNISPHKLRSTYGTTLYTESGDIYLVADALGHKDVNTTRKHYAKMDDERRRQASTYIKLRD